MHISTNNKPRLNGETNTKNEIKGRKKIKMVLDINKMLLSWIIVKSNNREIISYNKFHSKLRETIKHTYSLLIS